MTADIDPDLVEQVRSVYQAASSPNGGAPKRKPKGAPRTTAKGVEWFGNFLEQTKDGEDEPVRVGKTLGAIKASCEPTEHR